MGSRTLGNVKTAVIEYISVIFLFLSKRPFITNCLFFTCIFHCCWCWGEIFCFGPPWLLWGGSPWWRMITLIMNSSIQTMIFCIGVQTKQIFIAPGELWNSQNLDRTPIFSTCMLRCAPGVNHRMNIFVLDRVPGSHLQTSGV